VQKWRKCAGVSVARNREFDTSSHRQPAGRAVYAFASSGPPLLSSYLQFHRLRGSRLYFQEHWLLYAAYPCVLRSYGHESTVNVSAAGTAHAGVPTFTCRSSAASAAEELPLFRSSLNQKRPRRTRSGRKSRSVLRPALSFHCIGAALCLRARSYAATSLLKSIRIP
jgi:hypothetical protein